MKELKKSSACSFRDKGVYLLSVLSFAIELCFYLLMEVPLMTCFPLSCELSASASLMI